jgi:outer membrane receptor protein involved in Fe transport
LEVTNLTDELYYTSVFDQTSSSGTVSYAPALPRAYAVTIKHNFN